MKLHGTGVILDRRFQIALRWILAGLVIHNAVDAQASGDGLIFYDAYRPFDVQKKVKAAVDLVEKKPEYSALLTDSNAWHKGWFISQNISNHQRGTAADVGLKSARNSMPPYSGTRTHKNRLYSGS